MAFYEEFNGKRWDQFNSEKVCEVSYARIQGKGALLAHFEHSSLMHEDEMMQPVVFTSDGSGRREPFHWQQQRRNVPQANAHGRSSR